MKIRRVIIKQRQKIEEYIENRVVDFLGKKASGKKILVEKNGKKGRGIGSFFKKVKWLTKKAVNSDIGKFAVRQG